MTDETLEQEPTIKDVMYLLNGISSELGKINKRLDSYDVQFEATRNGIVANSVDFDRLTAKVSLLSADVKELSEEVRQNQKTLSLK